MNAIVGDWGNVFDTTILGIHQVVLEDGRVLYWGGDGNGNAFSNTQKYGIFDPVSGEHEILTADHAVRMFCGAGVILPGTDQVLIAGGNGTGAPGGQIFDTSDETLTRDTANDMATGRFYPTMVSLSTGQAVILGGNGSAERGTPEIFTVGEGWRSLEGAQDPDVAANWWYPKAWVNDAGEVVYFAVSSGNQNNGDGKTGPFELMALDPSGSGSIRQIGEVPFAMDAASPAAMYDVGKIVIMDASGDLWIMDINDDVPQFTFAADLGGDRNNSDMTVLPDGRVLINGGTKVGNSQDEANALFQSVIFDPYTEEVTLVDSEDVMRLYHSSTVLLKDGTLLSMGGGGLNGTKDFMDAQIYTPDYLFNDDGSLADRPEITAAPESLKPGETFTITVEDTSSLAKLSFVKTGAVTHSVDMESGRMDLEFRVIDNNSVEVSLPENPNVVGAGNWMLFAIDNEGVPSVAPIISVEPTVPLYVEPSNSLDPIDGELSVEYFEANVSKLDDVDFDASPLFAEDITKIDESAGRGSFYEGGPTDRFAAKYTGEFAIEDSGNYTFYLNSDDGSQLSIDGAEIISNDGLHAAKEVKATVYLEKGLHALDALYFEQGGIATMELDWSGPTFNRVTFEVDGSLSQGSDNFDDIPNEFQFLTGIGDNDVFVIDGQSSDYGWGPSEDGNGVVVWGATGADLLYDFEAIQFSDTKIDLVANDGVYQDIVGATQYLVGSADEVETFVIVGNSSDYQWGDTEDGAGIVIWSATSVDILYDFDKIQFSDTTIDLNAVTPPPTEGVVVQNDAAVVQFETGTEFTDQFVINGNSADFGWGETEDGLGYVVWNDNTGAHDILYDFEELKFNDQVVVLGDGNLL